jgi:hypothetical protein
MNMSFNFLVTWTRKHLGSDLDLDPKFVESLIRNRKLNFLNPALVPKQIVQI